MVAAAEKFVLTDRRLKVLKPAKPGRRYVVWDAQQPNFGVRVTDKGRVSFVVVRRRPGQHNHDWVVLGTYSPDASSDVPAVRKGPMGLQAARRMAHDALQTLASGRRQTEVEAERLLEAERQRRDTFAGALTAFLDGGELKGLRSAADTESVLRRDFLGQTRERTHRAEERDGRRAGKWTTVWKNGADPIWRDRPINQIARRDIVARLDELKRKRGKHAARHALAAIRRFFAWVAEGERYGIEVSPCTSVRDKLLGVTGRDLRRQRVLSDEEIADVWHACASGTEPHEPAYPFGAVVRLLMLTGQRRDDLAEASWREIDLNSGILLIPPERFKTDSAHEVMLTPAAVAVLKSVPTFTGQSVFTTTAGRRPISGFANMKARLDEAVTMRRQTEGREPMPHWTLHDLRRTVRTRLVSDCGIDSFIAERVIGHALPGLHAVYDRGSHRQQKRAAMEQWEARLMEIVGRKPSAPGADNLVAADELEQRRRRRQA